MGYHRSSNSRSITRLRCGAKRREFVNCGLAVAGSAALGGFPKPTRAANENEPPTVFEDLGRGVWSFTQAYGIPGLGIGANNIIRMTVLQLDGGGKMLYNPCNPTSECMEFFRAARLEDVRYIIIGTIAIEHKWFGPYWAAKFPQAEVWISPRTFTWPIDFGPYIPLVGYKLYKPPKLIPKDSTKAPWYSQGVDHLQLTVDYAPRTVFEETVLFHRSSGTIVCTDLCCGYFNEVPPILKRSPYREGLLWFARNDALDIVDVESAQVLQDGYQKSTLLLFNINPRSLLSYAAGNLSFADEASKALASTQKDLGYFGWYPCNWQEKDASCAKLDVQQASDIPKDPLCRPGWRGEWERLAAGVAGTGFQVPSFVAELQVSRDPEALRSLGEEIERRLIDVTQIVPSHGSAPLKASSADVRKVFGEAADGPPKLPARRADLSAILDFRDFLETNELIYKPKSGIGKWRAD